MDDLRPLFLGLDVGSKESHFALTRDGANWQAGGRVKAGTDTGCLIREGRAYRSDLPRPWHSTFGAELGSVIHPLLPDRKKP